MNLKFLIVFIFGLSVVGCISIPPPQQEYTLASAAMDSAKVVQSARYSPGFWHQAEEFYRRAKILYNEREYEEAKRLFLSAKAAAEKAENSSRLLRQKNGDVL